MYFPILFLGIMDFFLITNIHDAPPKTLRNNPNFYAHFSLLVYEKKTCLKNEYFFNLTIFFINEIYYYHKLSIFLLIICILNMIY